MASPHQHPAEDQAPDDDDESLLDADDAEEEIVQDDEDHPMSDDEAMDQGIQLQNDSAAYFDVHTDSIFCIAQHPTEPAIILTGGGDDVAYIWDSTPIPGPVLPSSYESNPQPKGERKGITPISKLDGHTDSVNAVTFTLPKGEYALTAGLDGRLRAWQPTNPSITSSTYKFLAESQEVQEINWISPCPHPSYPNVIALGANDGSVWVYQVSSDPSNHLEILQAYYLHTESSTAGSWTPDGNLLATISEDASFYVYDPFGEALAQGVSATNSGTQAIISLTAEDQRFAVEGGLYSIAIAPSGAFAAVGGAGGHIRVIGLPRLSVDPSSATSGQKGSGAKSKPSAAGGRKQAGSTGSSASSAGQAGTILASLQVQSDSVETLSFASPPSTLLAAGSVDGSIVLLDHVHRFAVRRHIREAHEEFAVVKVEFARPAPNTPSSNPSNAVHILTSAGYDGVLRRWDTRGGTTAAGQGFLKEWRGHRGDGEGGGIQGFVQAPNANGDRIITAGDDGVALVFDAKNLV
ncbi:putative 60s ribosome biogenesis protein [Phaeomoniella chlamydospora]|uniref:Putative 60s ribosome biogenesis protein n=1 Tax=Phaeomoniella chlamydospora TaxID=158046 RepID=A0A0G2EKG7_PHACM|nr:putative 60s ribosome biogenesis protein [Phaeomoniella chlamydospora]